MKILFGILLLLAITGMLVAGKFALHSILCFPLGKNIRTKLAIFARLFNDESVDLEFDRRTQSYLAS